MELAKLRRASDAAARDKEADPIWKVVPDLIEIAEAAEAYQRAMRSAGQPNAATTYQVMEAWAALDGALDHLKRDQK